MTQELRNRQWVLHETPTGEIADHHFEWREELARQPEAGEVLVRNLVVSCDPAQRGWMSQPTYREQMREKDVIDSFGVGEVVSSNNPDFAPGQIVEGMLGWQDYSILPGRELTIRNGDYSPEHLIGLLSITGLTAYFGLFEVGQLRPGDTVVVSAAAGAVGNIAGQLARIAGCRTIGIVGGPEKRQWIVDELGYDAAVDYKADDFEAQLQGACPQGIDLYFDNVGGNVLKAAMNNMNMYGRITSCGIMRLFDEEAPTATEIQSFLILKRATMRGFIVIDYLDKRADAERRLVSWVKDGRLKPVVEMHDGLETAPTALLNLLKGSNKGKVAVRVS